MYISKQVRKRAQGAIYTNLGPKYEQTSLGVKELVDLLIKDYKRMDLY